MYKKRIVAVSLTVGLGMLTALGIATEKNMYADSVQYMGDINGDGFTDAVDATGILVEYAKTSTGGKSTFSDVQKTLADIDKNGFIDAVDATYVLGYYAYTSTGGTLDIETWRENNAGTYTATSATTTTETSTSQTMTTFATTTTETGTSQATTASTTTTTETSTSQTTATSTTSVTTETTTTTTENVSMISEIRLSKNNIDIQIGGKDISYVTMLPENVANKDEIWTTSDEEIATVDQWGNVTGISAGTCTVTVTSVDNPKVKADIKVTVTDPNKISEISLSKNDIDIQVGGKDIVYVTMLPENVANKDEIWTTSDEEIATVDQWGNVTGISAGTCTVTVTSVDNPKVKADIKVTVTDPNKISEIKLSKTEMNICTGGKDIVYVTMLPENVENKDEIWTTSDEKIATVDEWGNVTGISAGTCTVTVTSVDNPSVKADIKVTVSEKTHNFQQINGLTYIDGILIANKSYSLPSAYDPGMDANTIKQFNVLSNDASKEGLNIYLSSGYRSYSYQQGIYNNYVSWYGKATADTFSARAGHSEHQTGLAIDVNTVDDSFAGTPEALWLEEHAHEYGFIVRYPKGKESITGYKYEPWHIRYLGVEKATDVYNSGLTLEEYLGIDSYYH